MSEEIEIGDQARLAAQLAVLGAGDPTASGWRTRVQQAIPHMAALVRDDFGYWGRDAQMVMDADVFKGVYKSHEVDDRNGRINVWLEGEENPMRTMQVNTPPGADMQRRLASLREGQELLIFKYMELMSGERGTKGQRARLLVHFELVRSKKNAAGSDAGTPHEAPSHAPAAVPSAPPPSAEGGEPSSPPSAPSPENATPLTERINLLSNAKKIALKKRCLAADIHDFANPSREHHMQVLEILKEIERE